MRGSAGAALLALLLVSGATEERGDTSPVEGAREVALPTLASPAREPGTGTMSPTPFGDGPSAPFVQTAPPYTGAFTFMRVQYGSSGLRGFRGRGREPPWAHDWPDAEINFTKILGEVSFVQSYVDHAGGYLTLDDPEIYRYPIIYLVEVGSWRPSDSDVLHLREYLLKGGFLIVDDFRDGQIYNFEAQMQRVLPGAMMLEVDDRHEIFNSFFAIEDPLAFAPPYGRSIPIYLGIFEENDPEKRLMAMINYNQDHMEYWEYSDRGYYPIALSNDAYKFGVNYVIYGMTH